MMAQPKLRFDFREPEVDTNRPFTDGTVEVEGFDLQVVTHVERLGPKAQYVGISADEAEGEPDARDVGFAELLDRKDKGDRFVCIPAFPNRKFRHSYIFVNSQAGIDSPKDLEGKRVAISGWANTAGVWARGALQDYYGVDLTRITWFAANPTAARVAEGIRIERLEKGGIAVLDDLLVSGEMDGVIIPDALPSITNRDPRVRRLFPDCKTEEQTYFEETGIFPISHIVTLTQDFVDQYPEAPVALLKAYRRARDIALDRIEGADPCVVTLPWASALMAEQRELMGDMYWAYNVETNRHVLDAATRFAHQQGLTANRLDYESFFDPAAAALPGA
jgi:4,5-dihydroxyphthalate decarboxylase